MESLNHESLEKVSSLPPRRWSAWLLVLALLGSFAAGALVEHVRVGRQATMAANILSQASTTVKVLGVGQPAPLQIEQQVKFQQFWDLWTLLKDKYYEQPVKDGDLFYGAMQGLAASLGDPYTVFFEPKTASDFQQSLQGRFQGIGAEIGIKDEQLVIIAPLPDTPAERAGLMAGDAIIKIDQQETNGMAVERAVQLIRGAKGTKVTLTIFRPATKKPPFDVSIERDEIFVKSVTWKTLPQNLALIEITHFNEDTAVEFEQAVGKVLKQKPKGLIIDLRNNPGGFLDTALSVAGEWVGRDVVLKERRRGQIINELQGVGRARLHDLPTIVLVNEGSASASEIVAGALQDYGQAKLVGKKTFGKGSVQDLQDLPDGSAVKITVYEWITPKERAINKVGIEPDVTVERTPEDYAADRDPQFDRAVGILTGKATSTAAVAPTSTRP